MLGMHFSAPLFGNSHQLHSFDDASVRLCKLEDLKRISVLDPEFLSALGLRV